jgi:CcmD family protein
LPREFDVGGAAVDFLLRKGNNLRVSLVFLAAVNVIIWIGLFAYLWRLDRRISAREKER